MSAMAHELPAQDAPTQEDILLEGFLGLHTPEGFRAELIEGEIVVAPPTDGDHEDCVNQLVRQVIRQSAVDMSVSGYKGLRLVSGGLCPRNHVIPDLTFAPEELRLFRGAPPWMDPAGVAMVVEVTSGKPAQDRVAKRHCYARAEIPLYLLVDRERSRLTLFATPHRDEYTEVRHAPFGHPLVLPAPFDFEVDSKPFL
ncbi:Uma2 family endonuclease [Kitasatospora sp. NPDC049258]|uniref:Uma2 family endonuclease n=1 Tax=Kitasatospora sp. NPDC049258 TaxID=3155394 RepID=UPI0034196994